MPPRRSSARVRQAPQSCSSASSRGIRRTSRASRSSVPPASCFDRALAEAEIDRATVYVTNAVKHFKFEPRGKRRIHQKPDYKEVLACRPWLEGELSAVKAATVVALGATAAQSLIRRTVTIGRERGRFQPYPPDRHLFVTVHPSYLLRLPDARGCAGGGVPSLCRRAGADRRWAAAGKGHADRAGFTVLATHPKRPLRPDPLSGLALRSLIRPCPPAGPATARASRCAALPSPSR